MSDLLRVISGVCHIVSHVPLRLRAAVSTVQGLTMQDYCVRLCGTVRLSG